MITELLYNTRTCRTFDESRRITKEELISMVDCARVAPASMNLQPLSYRLVYTDEELDAVQPLTGWGAALPELELPPKGHRPRAFIVICQDTAKFGEKIIEKDVGITALAIYLRAAELGLGGCMIGNFKREALAQALKLPETVRPVLVIGLGKPDEERRITAVKEDGSTRYFRENGIHYVPKRSLDDIII